MVSAEQLDAMQRVMCQIIADNPEELSICGSFYFIMEAKGIK